MPWWKHLHHLPAKELPIDESALIQEHGLWQARQQGQIITLNIPTGARIKILEFTLDIIRLIWSLWVLAASIFLGMQHGSAEPSIPQMRFADCNIVLIQLHLGGRGETDVHDDW